MLGSESLRPTTAVAVGPGGRLRYRRGRTRGQSWGAVVLFGRVITCVVLPESGVLDVG